MTKQKIVKFQLSELFTAGIGLVVLGVGLAYGLDVMADVQEDQCNSGYWYNTSTHNCCLGGNNCTTYGGYSDEFNATKDAMTGVAKIPEKMPTIATVVVASVIIGILITYLWQRFQ